MAPVERSAKVLEERPILAVGLIVVVATLSYGAISYLIDGRVNLVTTVAFAAAFAVVYVGFARYFDV